MAYTAPTLAQAQAALASRLNDSGFVRWTAAELALYLNEGLRVWQTWTSHWREQATFPTVGNQPFYDLGTVLPTLRGMTLTQDDLVSQIQYMLLEPATPTAWTGTQQFTLAQVTAALQRRRDQFLQLTGAIVTRSTTAYGATASGRLALDESVLTIRRLAWQVTSTQLTLPLIRTDEWSGAAYQPAWRDSERTPFGYSVTATPPLEVQVFPPPAAAGILDLIAVAQGASFPVPYTGPVLLGVPDDWAWVVLYGALGDLLSGDGLALDAPRASYCEQRWAEGLARASAAPVVVAATIDDQSIMLGALADADAMTPTWQMVVGAPFLAGLTGMNLFFTAPVAGSAAYTVGMDVVRNAPVPAADGDILQVNQFVYESLLDYAQHLALFKEGPGQLEQSLALFMRAAAAAGVETSIQQASQPARQPTLAQQRSDEGGNPRTLDTQETE